MAFVQATLPVWLYTLVTDLCCCCIGSSDQSMRRRGRLVGWLTSLLWRVAFRFCFWIRIEDEGLQSLQKAGRHGRQVFVAVNHVSWLDTPIVCAYLPSHLVGDMKTLMSRSHLRLPILGRLADAIGHMPVPFSSQARGEFGVDKERMAETLARVNAHIASGGHLIIFPEGDLNKEWETLLPFRAGGIELCIRHDMEVWGWVIAGTADCWPQTSALGGTPACITAQATLLYASAQDAARSLAGEDADLRTQAVALAEDMRARMQRSLDELTGRTCAAAGGEASEPLVT